MNYDILLLAHVICADHQIHNAEIEVLDQLLEKYQPCATTREAIESILTQGESHPSLEKCAQECAHTEDRGSLLRKVVEIAYSDGYLAPTEAEIINKIEKIWRLSKAEIHEAIIAAEESYRARQSHPSSQGSPSDMSLSAKAIRILEKTISRGAVKKLAEAAPSEIGETISRLQREVLLAGSDYDEAIQNCADIAQKDYQLIRAKLDHVNQALENLQASINKQAKNLEEFLKSKGSGSSREVMKQISATKDALAFKILEQLQRVRASLDAKSRALSHFSIAFMGKTKAGKSTLHAIITGEGWNAIGVGKQRTTRYNRIYEWKNIRIIDTPGIGAPGGQTDEEIAKSVIDESDVICYVVTTDSVQETEFQFLGLLEKHAKPLIVLMNIKNNLRDARRLEMFLKQPEKLFAREGSNSLEGHFNRIRGYVTKHYPNNAFEIIPVMLLAAQMSKEQQYLEIKEKLFKESRLQDFLDILRESIITYGTIRRSQTFLGSTVGNIEEPLKQIQNEIQAYKQMISSLREKKERVHRDIHRQQQNSEQQLKLEVSRIFQGLRSKISPFAAQNYKEKEEKLTRKWHAEVTSSNLSEKLEEAYRRVNENYNRNTAEILEEVGKEMELMVKLASGSFGKISNDYDGFSLKIASRILAMAGAVMTFTFPVTGLFVGILGSLAGWFSDFFKSEEQKRREAVERVCQNIKEQVDKQEEKTCNQAVSLLREQSGKVSNAIEAYFGGLIHGLELICNSLELTQDELEKVKTDVNLAYAARIINYCLDQHNRGKSKEEYVDIENNHGLIRSVERHFGSQIKISLSSKLPIPRILLELKYQEKISQILQEKIIIEQIKN